MRPRSVTRRTVASVGTPPRAAAVIDHSLTCGRRARIVAAHAPAGARRPTVATPSRRSSQVGTPSRLHCSRATQAADMRFRLAAPILCSLACAAPLAAQARGDDAVASLGDAPVTAPAAPAARARVASLNEAALARRDSLVAMARAQLGRKYRYGGETPERGFDCSGLVQYLLAAFDVSLPRTAAQQARVGTEIVRDTSQLRPGDLLTFGTGRRVSHIAIYIGAGRMVHASSAARRVVETPVDRAPHGLIKPWRGVRRIVFAVDSAAARERASVRLAALVAARGTP
jgi:cell wall-associated NlpC family hydrolase